MDATLGRTKDDVASLNKSVAGKNALNKELKCVQVKLNKYKKNVEILNQTNKEINKEIVDKNAIIQALRGESIIDDHDVIKLICSICTSKIGQNDSIVATRCGHIYHNDCLQPWLNT